MSDAFAKNTLGPFVLRLALAVIFIYHGVAKVSGANNTWGASWAVNQWQQQALPPKEVLDKMDGMKLDANESNNAAKIQFAKDRLRTAYEQSKEEPPASMRFHAAQLAVAWGELLGGFALLFGILTRWAAAGLLLLQIGAIATVTAARGFSFSAGGGAEFNVALIAMCLTLILVGGGTFAADRVVHFKRKAATESNTVPVHA